MDILSSTASSLLSSTTSIIPDLVDFHSYYLWAVIVGFILAFLLGGAMGANDVANAFGTSVGSKVLTIRQAYILASIMETLGALALGYNVATTIRKGIIDVDLYADEPKVLMLGQLAILGGSSSWLVIATIFKLPVSSTHSIVGATIGFSVLMKGFHGIHWFTVAKIASSWIVSPILSGIIALIMYLILDFVILRRSNPLKCGFLLLPVFFFLVFFVNSFIILMSGSKLFGIPVFPIPVTLVAAAVIGFTAALIVQFGLKPWLKKWLNEKYGSQNNLQIMNPETKNVPHQGGLKSSENPRHQKFEPSWSGFWNWLIPDANREEDQMTLMMFTPLQVFTACFAGFAHGANDVSNPIAPLIALLSIYNDLNVHQTAPVSIYMFIYGTFSVCVGLWLFGHRVIKTIGDDVSQVDPANGFIVEFGAASTAMIASKLGLPISTTHAVVGAVVGVGMVKPGANVDWKVIQKIASSWVITFPAGAILAAGLALILKLAM